MAPRRSTLATTVVDLIGPAATLVDAGTGWPSIIDLQLDDQESVRLAAHLAPVHSMARRGSEPLASRPKELRIQTPASNRPPRKPRGTLPLLLGLLPAIDEDGPALVIPSNPRLGSETRFTVRFPGSLAYEGARSGYAQHEATREERFWAISPRLLPAFVLMREQGIELPARVIRAAVEAADALADDEETTKERARVVTTRLARSSTFRPKVLEAYAPRCALCDIDLEFLLEAAHIFPVNLPGSSDDAANGLPVCLHHHALFDENKIHIDPGDLSVKLHPSLRSGQLGETLSRLAATTKEALEVPQGLSKAAVKRWLRKREEAHESALKWALAKS